MKTIVLFLLFCQMAIANYSVKFVSSSTNDTSFVSVFVKNQTSEIIQYRGFQFPLTSNSAPAFSDIIWTWNPNVGSSDIRIFPNSYLVIPFDLSLNVSMQILPNEEKLIMKGIVDKGVFNSTSNLPNRLMILRNDSIVDVGDVTTFLVDNLTNIITNNLSINSFNLYQNYPNPFNPQTTIEFQLPVETKVSLKIYNVLGTEIMKVLDDKRVLGSYQVTINMSNFSSGVYFYVLSYENKSLSKTLILSK